MSAGVVIVGGSQAGAQVAITLRDLGYSEPVTVLGEEPHPPYQRPPLSKTYLLGKVTTERLPFRPAAFYETHEIGIRTGLRVDAVDRRERSIRTSAGTFSYDKLVLATGARPRPLTVRGAELQGVFYLRTLDDARQLRHKLEEVERVVVIGGGFIGLEFASVAASLGKTVSVVESFDRLMARVVAPIISNYYVQVHESKGVSIELKQTVTELTAHGRHVSGVSTRYGDHFPADMVVVGIGVIPNVELAQECGLSCENGICVDEFGRTSDPHVYASGDVANHPNPFAGGARIRLESVQNAIDQSRTVARAITGDDTPYHVAPWFWSDQYDVKLQMVGFSVGYDEAVTRGDKQGGKFSVLYYRDKKLLAIDSINRPADHMAGRKLIARGVTVTAAQAADESIELKELLPA